MIGTLTRRGVAAALLLVLGLFVAAPAAADPGGATATLRTKSVYVDPAVTDRGVRLRAAELPAGVKIAVLPDTGVPALRLALQLVSAIQRGPMTVGVFTVSDDSHIAFHATSSHYCAAYVDEQAQAASAAQPGGSLDLTRTVADFAGRLATAPSGPTCTSPSVLAQPTSTGTVWPWLLTMAAVSVLGIGGLVVWSRRARERRPVAEFDGGQWW